MSGYRYVSRFIGLLVALFALVACSEYGPRAEYELEGEDASALAAENDGGMAEFASKKDDSSGATADVIRPSTVQDSRKLIKRADLSYQVETLAAFEQDLKQWLPAFNAYVSKDELIEDSYRITRTVELRMPVKQFDAMIDAIGSKVGKFDRRTIDVQDVTLIYADTEAELRNAKKLENRFIGLLEHAADLEQVLRLERELASQRKTIDQIEGRLKYLQRSTQLSTIVISVYVVIPRPVASDLPSRYEKSFGTQFVKAFESGWDGLKSFILALIALWPFLLFLAGVVWLVVWVIRKSSRERLAEKRASDDELAENEHVEDDGGEDDEKDGGEDDEK